MDSSDYADLSIPEHSVQKFRDILYNGFRDTQVPLFFPQIALLFTGIGFNGHYWTGLAECLHINKQKTTESYHYVLCFQPEFGFIVSLGF